MEFLLTFRDPRIKKVKIHCSIPFCLSLSLLLFAYMSLSLSYYQPIGLSVYPSLCLSIYICLCRFVSLSLCLYVSLSLCLSVYLSLCLPVSLSLCLSVSLSLWSVLLVSLFLYFCLSSSVCISFFDVSLSLKYFLKINFLTSLQCRDRQSASRPHLNLKHILLPHSLWS